MAGLWRSTSIGRRTGRGDRNPIDGLTQVEDRGRSLGARTPGALNGARADPEPLRRAVLHRLETVLTRPFRFCCRPAHPARARLATS